MKKIVFINPQSRHGPAKYDANLLSQMELNSVTYFCSAGTSLNLDNVKMLPIFKYHMHKNVLNIALSYMISLIMILKLIDARSIVHIQWSKLIVIDLMFLMILRYIFRCRLVLTAHNVLPYGKVGLFNFKLLSLYYFMFDRIVTHNNHSKQILCLAMPNLEGKIRVIPHAIGSSELCLPQTLPDRRSDENLKCLFYGRLTKNKGVVLLCQSILESVDLRQACNFRFLGKADPSVEYCLSEVNSFNEVEVINGAYSDQDLVSSYAWADLILLPYEEIYQSGVLCEVIANDKPFVASNIPAFKELCGLEFSNWLVKPNNQKALSDKLIQISKDYSIWNKINSQEKFDIVKSRNSAANSASLTVCLYEELKC